MDKETVNRRDSEFLQKVDNIRKKKEEIRKRKQRITRLLFSLIIVCSLSMAYFVIDVRSGRLGNKGNTGNAESPLQVVSEVSLQENNSIASVNNRLKEVKNTDVKAAPHQPRTNKDPSEKTTKAILTKVQSPTHAQIEKDAKQEIHVSRGAICKALDGRDPVNRQQIFSLKKSEYAIAWTEIKSTQIPCQIKHVYYLNGKKYCEVPLIINHPRTRTWSRITLQDEQQIGSWKVEVIEKNGRILKQMVFEVES